MTQVTPNPFTAEPRYQPKRLLPRHFAIIDMMLRGLGPTEIGAALQLTPGAISTISKSDLVQEELARRRSGLERRIEEETAIATKTAREQLEGFAEPAVAKLGQLLEAQDQKVQLRAAEAILEKVWGRDAKATQPIIITAENLQLLNVALAESDRGRGS